MERQITFGSLFAGIGGFDLGFERAGMVCKWQVEIDDYATRVLEKHWPNVPRWRDVRTFPPRGDWAVDVICGGFPCQDISYAGKGEGLDGDRSGLFYEAMRVIRTLGPRVVVLENVAALFTRGFDQVLGSLADCGFDAEWSIIPASSVGAPHRRERVFIVANTNSKRRTSDSIQAQVDAEGLCQPEAWRGNGPNVQQLSGVHGVRSRLFPPSGVCRMDDGLPQNVDRLRGLGNAVVPQVAEWIGRRVNEVLRSLEC